MLFNRFKSDFFIPLSHYLNSEHAERVACKLHSNYKETGQNVYRKEALQEIIISQSEGLSHYYTTDGLLESMEKGVWLEKEPTPKLIDDYIITDDLLDFCDAMLSIQTIHEKKEDLNSMVDIRDLIKKIDQEHSFDSINTVITMVNQDNAKIRRIKSRIERMIRKIKNAQSDSDALKECLKPDFIKIFQKDIGAVFSLKTDITAFITFFSDIVYANDQESEEKIKKIAKNGEMRVINGMDTETYIWSQFNNIYDTLQESKEIRSHIKNSFSAITRESSRRHKALLSFRTSYTAINYDDLLKKIDDNPGIEIPTTFLRILIGNPNDAMKLPEKKKEPVIADKIQEHENDVFRVREYDDAKKMTLSDAEKIIKERDYRELSDIKIDNIYDIMLFQLAEQIALAQTEHDGDIINNSYFTFHNRRLA